MFILLKKLKDKKQTDQQQKQAIHSIALYYELESNNFGKNGLSKDKSKKISTKKEGLELTNANWVPVYSDLTAEGNYHPKRVEVMNCYLTAKTLRAQRNDVLFCFSLRGRKAKSIQLRWVFSKRCPIL